jgi:hypothetical protein
VQVEETRPRSMIPAPPGPQCQNEVFAYRSQWDEKKFAERGWNLKKCSNGASIKIDGVGYCRQHAGSIAIQRLVELGKAEVTGAGND